MDNENDGKIIGYPAAYAVKETGVSFIVGKKGNALCSDGVEDGATFKGTGNTCLNHPNQCTKSGMTFAMWVKFGVISESSVTKWCVATKPRGINIKALQEQIIIEFHVQNPVKKVWTDSAYAYDIHSWLLIAGTYIESDGYKLFINGNLQSGITDTSYSKNFNGGSFGIGSEFGKSGTPVECCVDEVHVWSETKTLSFITSFMNHK